MEKLTDDELSLVPDFFRELYESLDDPVSPPNVYPYRPWYPTEIGLLRVAVNNGWLPAEDYPEIWSRCPWAPPYEH